MFLLMHNAKLYFSPFTINLVLCYTSTHVFESLFIFIPYNVLFFSCHFLCSTFECSICLVGKVFALLTFGIWFLSSFHMFTSWNIIFIFCSPSSSFEFLWGSILWSIYGSCVSFKAVKCFQFSILFRLIMLYIVFCA